MKESWSDTLWHALLAILLTLGLVIPLLQVLGLMHCLWYAVPACILPAAILIPAARIRYGKYILPAVLSVSALVWLFAAGGLSLCDELLQAILLKLDGMHAALPLYAVQAVILIGLLFSLISCVLTSKNAGAIPAVIPVILSAVIVWQTEDSTAMLLMLPAITAVLTLAARSAHDSVSVLRTMPAMAIAAAAALLLVPAGGVEIPEMKNAAQELRQKILDYFFFTDPRDVFSLANEGYSPEGINQLGGTAEPTDHLVMLVQTDRKTYLRGVIKNEYDGRAWHDTTGGRRYQWVSPRWKNERNRLFDMLLPSETIASSSVLTPTQLTIRMVENSQSTLFVPQRLRSLSVSSDMTPYFNNASEVFIARNLAAGDTYSVTAIPACGGDAGLGTLVDASASSADPDLWDTVCYQYTALPGHLQTQVFDLAREITAGADSAYDQACAIQSWLRRSCRYTLEVEPQDENVDFVSNFLLKTREGYCTYFASAMTVLCRMNGIPARYVEGYVAEPAENGIAYVTGLNAHAWVEVYFSGFGWLTFDPTPAVGDGSGPDNRYSRESGNQPPEQEPEPTPTPTPTPDPSSDASSEHDSSEPTPTPPEGSSENEPTPEPDELPSAEPPDTPETPEQDTSPAPQWWWLLLILAILIGLIVFRILWTAPEKTAARKQTEVQRWLVWLSALCELLRIKDLPKGAGESMAQYLRRLDTDGRLELIGLWSSAVFYGREEPTAEAVSQVSDAYHNMYRQLPTMKRLQLLWRRCIIPEKKRDFRAAYMPKVEKKKSRR